MSETPARSCCVEETATEETISPSAFCSCVRETSERYLILLSLHESVEEAVEGAVAVDVADDEGVARLVDDAKRGDGGEEAVRVGEDVQGAGVEHFDDRAGHSDRFFRYVVDPERDHVIALMCEGRRNATIRATCCVVVKKALRESRHLFIRGSMNTMLPLVAGFTQTNGSYFQ